MKTYEIVEGLDQVYEKYTDEDRLVWKTLFERQMVHLEKYADNTYLEGLEKIGFSAERIPHYKDVNLSLKELTGWSIKVVPGIISQVNFFDMLANKEFPSSTWLRKFSHLDYLSEPDMFHDGFGHIPMLTHKKFCLFFQKLGEIGVKYASNEEIVEKLGRLYWFTVEFGLIGTLKEHKIYGAGIISSIGETKYSMSKAPKKSIFNLKKVMATDFDNTVIQEHYFIIESFEMLLNSIHELENVLENHTKVIDA